MITAYRFKVTVKWIQIALILLSLLILAMFSSQAWLRKKTRPKRTNAGEKQPMPVYQ